MIAPDRFYSFTDVEDNTREQMQKARSHPWISPDVPVRGFVFDLETGRLHEVFLDAAKYHSTPSRTRLVDLARGGQDLFGHDRPWPIGGIVLQEASEHRKFSDAFCA